MNAFPGSRTGQLCLAHLLLVCLPQVTRGAFYVRQMDPVTGPPGTQVTLLGGGFDQASGPLSLTLAGATVGIDSVAADRLTFTIPTGAASGKVELSDTEQTATVPFPFEVTRTVPGTFELPPNLAGSGWFVATGNGLTDLNADGSFTVVVPVDFPAVVWAVRNGNEPSFMTLAQPEDNAVTINARTTAAALVYLVPPVASPDPQTASARWQAILANPQLTDLTSLIGADAAAGVDYLRDGRTEAIELAIVQAVLGQSGTMVPEGFRSGTPKGTHLIDLLPTPGVGPLTFDPVMDGHLTHNTTHDQFVFTYDTRREPSLDYVIDVYALDPAQFTTGLSSVRALKGDSPYTFLSSVPQEQGFVRAKLAGRKLDYFGFLYDTLMDRFTRPLDDHFKPNEFSFPDDQPGVHAAQAYSGNLWYGLDRSLLGQANLLDEIDPEHQWARTLGSNIALASLDLAGLFVDVKKLTGIDDAGYLDGVIKDTVKALLVYRRRGQITSTQVYDLVKTMANSIIKTFFLPSSEEDGSLVKKVGSLTFRITGTLASSLNLLKKIGTGLNIAERTFNLVSPKNLAVERAVFVLGDPFAPVITRIEPRSGREGTEVYVYGSSLFEYPAPGNTPQYPTVEFCTFEHTTTDPDNAPINASLAGEVLSAQPNQVVVKVPTGWTNTFGPTLKAYLCVTRAGSTNTGSSTHLGDQGQFEYIPPPQITGVEPAEIIANSHFLIKGSGFTPDCQVLVDDFFKLTPLRIERDKILVAFPDEPITGPHRLTVKSGNVVSPEFAVNIGLPPYIPPSGGGGLDITVTKMDLSNQPDGEISLLEAFLIANGTLGRTIEVHSPCEAITDPTAPGYCGGPQQRETDFVAGDDKYGRGGGPTNPDTITVSSAFQNQVFTLAGALPPLSGMDRVDFNNVTLVGTGASSAGAAITIDGSSAVQVHKVVLKGWPGIGIRVADGSQGVVLDSITVDSSGGAGILLTNGVKYCELTHLAIDHAGGPGLQLQGGCQYNRIAGAVVNFPAGEGVLVDDHCTANSFSDVTIQGSGRDGLLLDQQSDNNKLSRIGVATALGAGLRIRASSFNRLFSPAGGITDLDALFHPKSNILNGQDWGMVIEGGAAYNVISFQVVGQNETGGILVRGQGTAFNMIGKPYRQSPNLVEDKVSFPMVADNTGPGVRLAEGASFNTLICLNVAGNGDDGVQIDGAGTDSNDVKTVLTGFRFFIQGSDPQPAPNHGNGIAITGGASHNRITRWTHGTGLIDGNNGPFRNSIQLDVGNGILIDGKGTTDNRVDSTTVGGNEDTTLLGQNGSTLAMYPVGSNGIVISGGASSNRIGSLDLADVVRIDSAPASGVLLEGAGTDGNQLAGCFLDDPEVYYDYQGDPASACAFGICLRDGPKGNLIGLPGPLRGNTGLGLGNINQVNNVLYCRQAGIVLDHCGGVIDASGQRQLPNRLQNNQISYCPVGLLIQNGAGVNDIGGPRHGPRGFVQFDQYYTIEENTISDCSVAGVQIHDNILPDPAHRNIFLNTEITSGIIRTNAPDYRNGPPGGVGVLIDGTSTGNVVGESLNDARNRVAYTPIGVYCDAVTNNLVRGWDLTGDDFGFTPVRLIAGVIVSAGVANQIGGDRWGRRNDIHYWKSLPTDEGSGVMVLGGSKNRIVNNNIRQNKKNGVFVEDSAENTIGGAGAAANVIGDNEGNGVLVRGAGAVDNAIQANWIGADRTGAAAANQGSGIRFEANAANNQVGGSALLTRSGTSLTAPAGNTIAFNTGFGVEVDGAGTHGITILNNSINGNAKGGITLENGGNDGLQPPVNMTFANSQITGSVADLNAAPAGSLVQVFSDSDGQGEALLGETTVKAGGAWAITSLLPAPYRNITVTVTSASTGSTSEFGLADQVPAGFTLARSDGAPVPRTIPFQGSITVLHLTAQALGASVRLDKLTLEAKGTLADNTAIGHVKLYLDANHNGALDSTDFILGDSARYSTDNGTAQILTPGLIVEPAAPQQWLVVYEAAQSVPTNTTFSAQITSASSVNAEFDFPIGSTAVAQAAYPIQSDHFTVGPSVASPFEQWRSLHFADALNDPTVSGPNADPDRDGIPNLIEYAAGTDPRVADSASPVRARLENNRYVVVFVHDTAATGISISAEASTDLMTWSTGAPLLQVPPEVVPNGDGTETIQFLSGRTVSLQDHLFVRLAVQLDPTAPLR